MQKKVLALVGALVAAVAFAGENKYLGRTASVAGQPVTNTTTLFPFAIPPGAKVTFYCSVATNVLTDTTLIAAVYDGGAPLGVPFSATTLYPTSVGQQRTVVINPDGGAPSPTALVVIQPTVSGAGFCDWWSRIGDE